MTTLKNKIRTFILLSFITTAAIHIINRIQYSLYTVKNYLQYKNNNYYEWRFGKLRYIKEGNGTPTLLIHDLTVGSSIYEFSKIINSLSNNHEVFAIDLLGYGLSDKPNMTYTNYLYVQLVNDFIKNIIGKKADIIATGSSSQIAIMACHNDPENINKMIFINPQSLYESNQIPSKQTKVFKLLLEIPVIGTFIYNLFTNKASIEKTFKKEYFYNPLNIEDKDILAYVEAAHLPDHSSRHVFASYVGKYINTNIIHALKEINHSIYIIGGASKEDIRTTLENYLYYNSAIESSYIPYSKHLPHLETPENVINHIEMFLTSF